MEGDKDKFQVVYSTAHEAIVRPSVTHGWPTGSLAHTFGLDVVPLYPIG